MTAQKRVLKQALGITTRRLNELVAFFKDELPLRWLHRRAKNDERVEPILLKRLRSRLANEEPAIAAIASDEHLNSLIVLAIEEWHELHDVESDEEGAPHSMRKRRSTNHTSNQPQQPAQAFSHPPQPPPPQPPRIPPPPAQPTAPAPAYSPPNPPTVHPAPATTQPSPSHPVPVVPQPPPVHQVPAAPPANKRHRSPGDSDAERAKRQRISFWQSPTPMAITRVRTGWNDAKVVDACLKLVLTPDVHVLESSSLADSENHFKQLPRSQLPIFVHAMYIESEDGQTGRWASLLFDPSASTCEIRDPHRLGDQESPNTEATAQAGALFPGIDWVFQSRQSVMTQEFSIDDGGMVAILSTLFASAKTKLPPKVDLTLVRHILAGALGIEDAAQSALLDAGPDPLPPKPVATPQNPQVADHDIDGRETAVKAELQAIEAFRTAEKKMKESRETLDKMQWVIARTVSRVKGLTTAARMLREANDTLSECSSGNPSAMLAPGYEAVSRTQLGLLAKAETQEPALQKIVKRLNELDAELRVREGGCRR